MVSHDFRNRAIDLITAHADALMASNSPEAQAAAQDLRDFLADEQRQRFEARVLRLRAKQDEIAEDDRLTLRFGADWS